MIKPKRITLVDQISRSLREEIITGVYTPASDLPSEKDLMARYEVSRLTIRSALQRLAREGFIEIVQGRGNRVRFFREHIGPNLFPEFMLASPGKIVSDRVFSTFRRYIHWLHGNIWMEACRNAKPSDENKLIEINARIHEKMHFIDVWETEFTLGREFLRIGDNLLLMMHYNVYVETIMKFIADGAIQEPAYPYSFYGEYSVRLVKVICANDMAGLFGLMRELERYSRDILERYFNKLIQGFEAREEARRRMSAPGGTT